MHCAHYAGHKIIFDYNIQNIIIIILLILGYQM